MTEPTELLAQMLRIPSTSRNEAALAQFLAAEMTRFGLNGRVDAAGNAVGEIGSGPTVVLLGHIDTVPGDIPVRLADGRLYGRGAVDAKGPFAAFVAAAARLAAEGGLRHRLVLVGAVEEEAASSKGAHYAKQQYAPVACVIGEPSGWDKLTLGYKGRLLLDARWAQPMAHSAGRGVAVAERAVGFWNRLAAHCASFNSDKSRLFDQLLPSLRSFQTGSDGLTDWAEITIGVRLPPSVPPEALATAIELLASDPASAAGSGGEAPGDRGGSPGDHMGSPGDHMGSPLLRFRDACPAYQGDKNTPLVRALLRGVRATGGTPGFLLKTGTSDMNVVGPVWQCPILAYGPGDSDLDHTPQEHIVIAEYLQAIDILSQALRNL